jgi:hypothetical protein
VKLRLAALAAPVLLALGLLAPAPTFATTGYTFSIVNQHCISGGYGHNPYLRVSVTAAGSTPANKLNVKAVSQYFAGGRWHTFYHWAVDSEKFTPNGKAHTADWSYDHVDGSDTRKWRIVATLKALKNNTVLAHKTLTSKPC